MIIGWPYRFTRFARSFPTGDWNNRCQTASIYGLETASRLRSATHQEREEGAEKETGSYESVWLPTTARCSSFPSESLAIQWRRGQWRRGLDSTVRSRWCAYIHRQTQNQYFRSRLLRFARSWRFFNCAKRFRSLRTNTQSHRQEEETANCRLYFIS